MEGIITAIKRNAIHDGDGLRTTVFFKGCPLRCIWCHNPETYSFRSQVGFYAHKCIGCGYCQTACPSGSIRMVSCKPVTEKCTGCLACTAVCPADARVGYGTAWQLQPLIHKLTEDKPFFDNSGGGVTLSGGECLAQPEFAVTLAKALHENGIRVNIDTCGCVKQEIFKQIIPYTDTFLYDIKAVDPQVHLRCTGRDNALILSNLRYLSACGCRIEIRYPYVPGYNDGECDKIGAFLSTLSGITKVKVLAYHNLAGSKYEALGIPNTLPDVTVLAHDLDKPVRILKAYGLSAVNGMADS